MIVAVADTHAAIWYLFSDPRLGKAASAFIDDTIAKGNHIGVSAITLAEMVYLVEKARIPAGECIERPSHGDRRSEVRPATYPRR